MPAGKWAWYAPATKKGNYTPTNGLSKTTKTDLNEEIKSIMNINSGN